MTVCLHLTDHYDKCSTPGITLVVERGGVNGLRIAFDRWSQLPSLGHHCMADSYNKLKVLFRWRSNLTFSQQICRYALMVYDNVNDILG